MNLEITSEQLVNLEHEELKRKIQQGLDDFAAGRFVEWNMEEFLKEVHKEYENRKAAQS